MIGTPNQNERLEFTGLIGSIARGNSVFFTWKHLCKNYL